MLACNSTKASTTSELGINCIDAGQLTPAASAGDTEEITKHEEASG